MFLTLFRPMEFSIKFGRVKSEWSVVYIEGSQVIISKYCFTFFLANGADPEEMSQLRHFIWVFTFCESTHLGVSNLQRLNQYPTLYKLTILHALVNFISG